MRQYALFGRFFLVAGLPGGLATLASQPTPHARVVEPKPAAPHMVPALLIDRTPRPAASAPRNIVVDREPPDHCFERPRPGENRQLSCG